MIKAIVFDLDGTLTVPASGAAWLELTKGLGGNADEHLEIFKKLTTGEVSLEDAKEKLLISWNLYGPVNKKRAQEIFSLIPLREDAEEMVRYLRSKNYLLSLITGSPNTYAEVFAKKLSILEYFANDFVYDKNENLIDFIYDPAQDEKKLRQLQEFLARHNLQPQECAAVGDGWNDSKMFLYTGRGIALKAPNGSAFWDSRLETVAWRVIESLVQLKEIL